MSSSLPKEISDEEFLYRTIRNNPDWWNDDIDFPSTVIYKDDKGVSVDRDGGRDESEIITSLTQRFSKDLRAVAKIKTSDCRQIGTHPIYKPSKNIYHSEIHESSSVIEISSIKAYLMIKKTIVVHPQPSRIYPEET